MYVGSNALKLCIPEHHKYSPSSYLPFLSVFDCFMIYC